MYDVIGFLTRQKAESYQIIMLMHLHFSFHDDSTVVAHTGDGNFHTLILFDPNNEEHRREAERLNHFMVCTALKMEGILS